MIFSNRRKFLARIVLFGIASLFAGVHADDAMAQSPAPLRVDPVLLGLPPAKSAETPTAQPPVQPERPRTEVRPVEAPVVEARPVESTTEPAQPPSRESAAKAVAPAQAKPVASGSVPRPQQPVAASPVEVSPRRSEPTSQKQADPVVPRQTSMTGAVSQSSTTEQPEQKSETKPVSVPSGEKEPNRNVTALTPLRVDPALLGLPPSAPAALPDTRLAGPDAASPVTGKKSAPSAVADSVQSTSGTISTPQQATQQTPSAQVQAPAVAASRTQSAIQAPASTVSAATVDNRVTTLAPLRVDPALLGLPPLIAAMVPDPQTGRLPVDENDEDDEGDPHPALALRSARSMVPPPKNSQVPRPVFLSAYLMRGNVDREFNAEGNAELRKIGTVVNADRLTYWPVEDEMEAEGNVRLELGNDEISGPKMRMKVEEQTGYFEQPSYVLRRQPRPDSKSAADKAFAQDFLERQRQSDFWNSGFASPKVYDIKPGQTKLKDSLKSEAPSEARGNADRIDFEGENQVRLTNGTFTTCAPGNDDWYARAVDLRLDYDREVGEGTDGTIYFKGVPIIHSPWLSFSLNNKRKSGFLPPSIGTNSDSGFEVSTPYYWNIAPNMDATIEPRVMSRRGVQVKNEFRYLDAAYGGLYRGTAHLEYLPSDRLENDDKRYGISLLHNQTTANGFSALINYNKVSDDKYFTDLSSDVAATSQTQLLQQGMLTYGGGGWWTAAANFQQYQTLQPDLKNPIREPYKMLPQVTVNARKPDMFLTDSSFMGQYTHFTRPDQLISGVKYSSDSAQRTVLYPQIALPYVTPGWYVTPKIGVNSRHYSISGQPTLPENSINVTLPIFSVDSGMTFERPSNWFGRDYLQTMEPRLYYLNIPYKNQQDIPVYDSALADFNFAQIFSENQFTGWDRVNNANQLTAAMTSRLLDPSTGNEIMRAMVGQRFYFERNKVSLNTSTTTNSDDQSWKKSDFLAAFSGQVLPKVYADAAWQYNLNNRHLERYSMGMSYRPEPGKVLNAAYRYNDDENTPVNQIDVSGQWPLSGRWHGVGRINYSFKDSGTTLSTGSQGGRVVEGLAGLEYNGGCWVVRGVVKRLALTEDKSSTAFFIQLELSGLGRLGSNPLSYLKRSIPGYSLINQPTDELYSGE